MGRTTSDRNGFDRRTLLAGAALLGGAASLGHAWAEEAATPQPGGTLRLGMSGGATSDSLDPRTITDWVPVNLAYQIMNGFIEVDEKNQPVPELLERWEFKPGAADWIFDVRKDVTFSNGKTLDADDIIYSLNLHRGDSKSAAKATLSDIAEVRKLGPHQVGITMSSGNVDLPYLLADYHFVVVPDGWTDWMKPVGTGAYTLEAFQPGIRSLTKKRDGGYWKTGRAHVDAIEIICITDTTARTNALISGQVDVINRLDARTVDLMKRKPGLQVIRNPAGQHATFLMNVLDKPYDDNNVRLALKYGIDRQKIIDTVLHGYGSLGNDHPIPKTSPFHADLPQRAYDPDKAKFYLRQANVTSLPVTLDVSDAAFTGAVDASELYQEAGKAAGIDMSVARKSSDGYFSTVWMKSPFCVSYWGGRPTADQMLTIAYKSDAAWNETFWKRPEFDRILLAARIEADEAKRKSMYFDLQKMISDDGGAVIPMFIDYLEAGAAHVRGMGPHPLFDLMGQRIGEKVWLAS